MVKDNEKEKHIVIQGVTETGEDFRPSDWAERVSGPLATFHNHRITYSPLLKPGMQNGNKCVFISEKLKTTNPEVYHQLLEFAKANKLKVGNTSEIDPEEPEEKE